jgi:hypothetical protein
VLKGQRGTLSVLPEVVEEEVALIIQAMNKVCLAMQPRRSHVQSRTRVILCLPIDALKSYLVDTVVAAFRDREAGSNSNRSRRPDDGSRPDRPPRGTVGFQDLSLSRLTSFS